MKYSSRHRNSEFNLDQFTTSKNNTQRSLNKRLNYDTESKEKIVEV